MVQGFFNRGQDSFVIGGVDLAKQENETPSEEQGFTEEGAFLKNEDLTENAPQDAENVDSTNGEISKLREVIEIVKASENQYYALALPKLQGALTCLEAAE